MVEFLDIRLKCPVNTDWPEYDALDTKVYRYINPDTIESVVFGKDRDQLMCVINNLYHLVYPDDVITLLHYLGMHKIDINNMDRSLVNA